MLRLLALLVSIAVASVVVIRLAQADPPEQRIANEIAELRQQVGPSGQVVGDQQEFAQAVQDVAEQSGTQWQGNGLSNDSYDRPSFDGFQNVQPASGTGWESSSSSSWNGQQAPTRDQPAGNYSAGSPTANPYWAPPPGKRFGRDVYQGPPPHRAGHGPPQGPPRSKSPQELLRTSAFELDRLAHELEMAEQFKEADALREAAGTLRKSARKSGQEEADKPSPQAGDRKRRRAARQEVPAEARRLLRQLEASRSENARLKKALLQNAQENADRILEEAERKMLKNEREMLKKLPKKAADAFRSELNKQADERKDRKKADPGKPDLLDDGGRLPRVDRPELPKRDLDLMAPPIGIHGGPTEGLERAIDEARSQSQQAQPAQPAEILPADGD